MSSRIVVVGGTLVDGRSEEPIENGVVIVDSGRVAFAGKASAFDRATDDIVIDAHGGTVLPGLIDCHLHLSGILQPDPIAWMLEPARQQAIVSAGDAAALLGAGVTTVCEVSRNGAHLRRLISSGQAAGPRVLPCGPGISRTGGFNADSDGFPAEMVRAGHPYATLADGENELRHVVRELLRDGSECIKVWATGPLGRRRPFDTGAELTLGELSVVVEEASAWGVPVQAHCESPAGGRNAVTAGVGIIVHGDNLDDDTLAMMAEAGTTLLPTLALSFESSADPYDYEDLLPPLELADQPSVDRRQSERDLILSTFRNARRHGVAVALGSDTYCRAATPYGDFTLRELQALVAAGLTPFEALVCGTRRSAEALGIAHDTGTLQSGMRGDVVVVQGDLVADISLFRRDMVLAVIRDGRIVAGSIAGATSAG